MALLVTVSDDRLHVGGLNAIGWGPWALVNPVKAIRVGVGDWKKSKLEFSQRWFFDDFCALNTDALCG